MKPFRKVPSPDQVQEAQVVEIVAREVGVSYETELRAKAIYYTARLFDVNRETALTTLMRACNIDKGQAASFLRSFKEQLDTLDKSLDTRHVRKELIHLLEGSKIRSMRFSMMAQAAIDPRPDTDVPQPSVGPKGALTLLNPSEALAEARNEDKFQIQLWERILAMQEIAKSDADENELGERNKTAIEELLDVKRRLDGKG